EPPDCPKDHWNRVVGPKHFAQFVGANALNHRLQDYREAGVAVVRFTSQSKTPHPSWVYSLRAKRYPSASIRLSRSFLLVTPVTWSRNCPFLKKSRAGIA